jgi:hypothetical protein
LAKELNIEWYRAKKAAGAVEVKKELKTILQK